LPHTPWCGTIGPLDCQSNLLELANRALRAGGGAWAGGGGGGGTNSITLDGKTGTAYVASFLQCQTIIGSVDLTAGAVCKIPVKGMIPVGYDQARSCSEPRNNTIIVTKKKQKNQWTRDHTQQKPIRYAVFVETDYGVN